MEKVTKVTLEALLSDIDDVAKKLAAVRGVVVGLIPPPEEPTPVEVGFDALIKRGSGIGSFGIAALNGLPHGPRILDTLDETARGLYDGRVAMCAPGGDPSSTYCATRSAVCFPHGWAAYEAGRSDSVQSGLSEKEARRWCLDGVLP